MCANRRGREPLRANVSYKSSRVNFSLGDGTNDRLKKKGTGDFQYPFMFGIWLGGGASPLSLAGLRPSRDLLFVSQKSEKKHGEFCQGDCALRSAFRSRNTAYCSRDLLFVSQKSRQNATARRRGYIFPADVAAVENVVAISVRENNCPAPLASPANAPARNLLSPH